MLFCCFFFPFMRGILPWVFFSFSLFFLIATDSSVSGNFTFSYLSTSHLLHFAGESPQHLVVNKMMLIGFITQIFLSTIFKIIFCCSEFSFMGGILASIFFSFLIYLWIATDSSVSASNLLHIAGESPQHLVVYKIMLIGFITLNFFMYNNFIFLFLISIHEEFYFEFSFHIHFSF